MTSITPRVNRVTRMLKPNGDAYVWGCWPDLGRRPLPPGIDHDSALLFTPLVWTVADGRANPNDVVIPIRAFQRDRAFH